MDFFDSISHSRSQDAAIIERLRQERQQQRGLILTVVSVGAYENVITILVQNGIISECEVDGRKTYPLTRKGEWLARLEAENG